MKRSLISRRLNKSDHSSSNIRKNRTRKVLKLKSDRHIRLSVFMSNQNTDAQLIDDREGKTLCYISTLQKKLFPNLDSSSNKSAAEVVGTEIAKRAKEIGISQIVFDRGSKRYHGRVKALADAARSGGLDF